MQIDLPRGFLLSSLVLTRRNFCVVTVVFSLNESIIFYVLPKIPLSTLYCYQTPPPEYDSYYIFALGYVISRTNVNQYFAYLRHPTELIYISLTRTAVQHFIVAYDSHTVRRKGNAYNTSVTLEHV